MLLVRLVLDTNIVVSGLLWDNAPSKLLDAALEGRIEIFTSRVLLLELADVQPRATFAKRVAAAQLSIEQLIARYAVLAQSVEPAVISPVSPDPDDDHVLACALGAGVDLIVSGDADLLNLKHYQRIPIVLPGEALAHIEKQQIS
jgi:putative PIN family toxin of toxin-antitoxin system